MTHGVIPAQAGIQSGELTCHYQNANIPKPAGAHAARTGKSLSGL